LLSCHNFHKKEKATMKFHVLALAAVCAAGPTISAGASPHPRPIYGVLKAEANPVDVFDDTIRYDNGQIQWWYGGLHNFYLITKFTPLERFELQRIIVALQDSNLVAPLQLWVKADNNNSPGSVLWSGSLLYQSSNTWLGVTISPAESLIFEAEQSFWLELYSVGPPYECYDESQSQPPRSFTNYPAVSPGDNFIRAVGQYAGVICDAGVDSIWHDDAYFLPDVGNYQIGCRVKNYGNEIANISVSCSLMTADLMPLALIGTQDIQGLPPGNSVPISFPNFALSTAGNYLFKVRTVCGDDHNPENDVGMIETEIYSIPPSAELTYDNGNSCGAATVAEEGDGWAMKFNPHQGGGYRIVAVTAAVDTGIVNNPARLQILKATTFGGLPGEILWQSLQTLHEGWNTIPVDVPTTGSFYVAYLFEYGVDTPALCYSDPPISNQSWQKVNGVWMPDPAINDWMLRTTVDTSSTGGGNPVYWIELTALGSIYIPSNGGYLNYNISGGNSGSGPGSADVWLTVSLPGGSVFGPICGPIFDFILPAGYSLSRDRRLNVPGSAPPGGYALNSYIGEYDSANPVVFAESHLTFYKTNRRNAEEASPQTDATSPWWDEEITPESCGGITLQGNYPNPFNPTTAIRFTLDHDSPVTLTLHNLEGRLLGVILQGDLKSGSHEVRFYGADYPSGIYLYRLKYDGGSTAGKMVLMK
jgi:hypothetical protein